MLVSMAHCPRASRAFGQSDKEEKKSFGHSPSHPITPPPRTRLTGPSMASPPPRPRFSKRTATSSASKIGPRRDEVRTYTSAHNGVTPSTSAGDRRIESRGRRGPNVGATPVSTPQQLRARAGPRPLPPPPAFRPRAVRGAARHPGLTTPTARSHRAGHRDRHDLQRRRHLGRQITALAPLPAGARPRCSPGASRIEERASSTGGTLSHSETSERWPRDYVDHDNWARVRPYVSSTKTVGARRPLRPRSLALAPRARGLRPPPRRQRRPATTSSLPFESPKTGAARGPNPADAFASPPVGCTNERLGPARSHLTRAHQRPRLHATLHINTPTRQRPEGRALSSSTSRSITTLCSRRLPPGAVTKPSTGQHRPDVFYPYASTRCRALPVTTTARGPLVLPRATRDWPRGQDCFGTHKPTSFTPPDPAPAHADFFWN